MMEHTDYDNPNHLLQQKKLPCERWKFLLPLLTIIFLFFAGYWNFEDEFSFVSLFPIDYPNTRLYFLFGVTLLLFIPYVIVTCKRLKNQEKRLLQSKLPVGFCLCGLIGVLMVNVGFIFTLWFQSYWYSDIYKRAYQIEQVEIRKIKGSTSGSSSTDAVLMKECPYVEFSTQNTDDVAPYRKVYASPDMGYLPKAWRMPH